MNPMDKIPCAICDRDFREEELDEYGFCADCADAIEEEEEDEYG